MLTQRARSHCNPFFIKENDVLGPRTNPIFVLHETADCPHRGLHEYLTVSGQYRRRGRPLGIESLKAACAIVGTSDAVAYPQPPPFFDEMLLRVYNDS